MKEWINAPIIKIADLILKEEQEKQVSELTFI
jgi:hypothetical protein